MTGYLEKGIRKSVALPARYFRYLLQHCFGFDKWHTSSLYERKYARDIIRHLNARPKENRQSVIEIGCGLGDIIRHLHYACRTGYDQNRPALKAARFLAAITVNRHIGFEWFEFPGSSLNGKADSIIMVNWIHHIPPNDLKSKIEDYFVNHLFPGGEIIIDTVQDKEYKFNHDIGFLTKDSAATVSKIGDYERERTIWALKK